MTGGLRSLYCISFGVQFQLTADSDLLLAAMQESAPFGTEFSVAPTGDARQFTLLASREGTGYRLIADGESVAEELKLILDQLARDLMVHVANHAPDRVFVHAGVVGWQGHALVLPGASFAGKTTLVAELVRAGAIYYSDEYAVLDERGQVHPYARDLQIRGTGGSEQRAVAVEDLNGSTGAAPLSVSHVVFAEYVECGRWSPEPVSAGMAVLEMLRHTVPVQRTPARAMATLARMMETAIALRSERSDASEAAGWLLTAMNARSGKSSI
jgi:hypothetical protein